MTIAAAVFLASCASGASEQAAGSHRCDESTATPQATTESYELAVGVSDAKRLVGRHSATAATRGEIVLGGERSRGPVHLDVRICRRDTGRPVGVLPTITVTDRSSGQTRSLLVAKLTGVSEGRAGIHYGNNVVIPHQAALGVEVDGERAKLIPPTG